MNKSLEANWRDRACRDDCPECESYHQRSMKKALVDNYDALSEQAQTILRSISFRLLKGQKEHGTLDVCDPSVDWKKEKREELLDALVYDEFQRTREEQEAADTDESVVSGAKPEPVPGICRDNCPECAALAHQEAQRAADIAKAEAHRASLDTGTHRSEEWVFKRSSCDNCADYDARLWVFFVSRKKP